MARQRITTNEAGAWLMLGVGTLLALKFFGPDRPDDGDVQDQPVNTDLDARPRSYPAQVYAAKADALDQMLFGWLILDQPAIMRELLTMHTTADVLALVKAYGSRFHVVPFGQYTLGEALRTKLDQQWLDGINTAIARKGIRYNF